MKRVASTADRGMMGYLQGADPLFADHGVIMAIIMAKVDVVKAKMNRVLFEFLLRKSRMTRRNFFDDVFRAES